MKLLTFLQNFAPHRAGSVAGFEDEKAKTILEAKVGDKPVAKLYEKHDMKDVTVTKTATAKKVVAKKGKK